MGELRLSEDAAAMRILAARAARRFPAILDALAQCRLRLCAVVLLALYLTRGTADALLAAATHRSKAEIERLLAARLRGRMRRSGWRRSRRRRSLRRPIKVPRGPLKTDPP